MENINTRRKGAIAVAAAINYFTKQNRSVFVPIADCDKYDIIVDNGNLERIQCKYTSEKSNKDSFAVRLLTFGGYRQKTYKTKYINGDFDLLFVRCSNGSKFLIPAENIVGKSEIAVSSKKNSPWTKYFLG